MLTKLGLPPNSIISSVQYKYKIQLIVLSYTYKLFYNNLNLCCLFVVEI